MELKIDSKKKLFAAYHWNLYVKSIYEDIFKELFDEWDIRHGSDVTIKNEDSSEIEKFLNRNKHLYDIFVSAIEKSDFFIADITGLNPNVMLELGIAIQLKKNVLIVTSEELSELPFDVSGFRVSRYSDKEELKKIINHELSIYKKIKEQSFSKYFDECYTPFLSEGELKHGGLLRLPIPRNIKNLRLKVEYKFVDISDNRDWFGVHLRVEPGAVLRSELAYVRHNLSLESVSFPGRRIPELGKKTEDDQQKINDGFKILELILEEDTLKILTPDSELEDSNIQNENMGGIALHAYAHGKSPEKLAVRYRNIEILSLDTIS